MRKPVITLLGSPRIVHVNWWRENYPMSRVLLVRAEQKYYLKDEWKTRTLIYIAQPVVIDRKIISWKVYHDHDWKRRNIMVAAQSVKLLPYMEYSKEEKWH